MILKQVSIKNFKGIEKCTIDLAGGFNLLIGNNGHGKTSILEAISVGLGGFIAGIEDINTKHFTTDEIRVVLEKQGDGSFNRRYMTPVEVECYGEIEGREYRWGRKKNSIRASRSTIEPRDICRKAAEMANEENHTLPILSYQSTARMWMQKREASVDIFAKKFYRTVGYESCLVEASNVKMMMNWIRHMEKMEWK
ncbi:MAG: AAA family ATPase, partial [Lachnospiraceae bacterium]|nr:AAA family ATPase [Lachnospiraceae bacterium]